MQPNANQILLGDNLPHLRRMADESAALIYIDPPFNTGKTQARKRIRATAVEDAAPADQGDRTGFGGRRYQTEVVGDAGGYADSFPDYLGFLRPRLVEAHRILTANGSLFFHIDWRESARCRLLLEEIFGGPRHCINEIIWVYDFGARSRSRWSPKHDNIYWFAKDPDNYIFNDDQIDRIPYMTPDLVGGEKAAQGKPPTDSWWQTIVPTNGREKTGYPTQKPLAILDRIVRVHSNIHDTVLDFFAGSGTTGEAALRNDRRFVLIDENPEAVRVTKKRLNEWRKQNVWSKPMQNKEYEQVKRIVGDLYSQHPADTRWKNWQNSPFEWIENAMPASKGKLGKAIVKGFLTDNGFEVRLCRASGADLVVDGVKVRVKSSTLWESGIYNFQQIREEDYEILFCLGISPHSVHAWAVSKSDIVWSDMKHQHGGSKGSSAQKNTWWIQCRPQGSSLSWMHPKSGNLTRVCSELRKMLSP